MNRDIIFKESSWQVKIQCRAIVFSEANASIKSHIHIGCKEGAITLSCTAIVCVEGYQVIIKCGVNNYYILDSKNI